MMRSKAEIDDDFVNLNLVANWIKKVPVHGRQEEIDRFDKVAKRLCNDFNGSLIYMQYMCGECSRDKLIQLLQEERGLI
nr:hypothetical protein [uncultured Undibacterium sp.]